MKVVVHLTAALVVSLIAKESAYAQILCVQRTGVVTAVSAKKCPAKTKLFPLPGQASKGDKGDRGDVGPQG